MDTVFVEPVLNATRVFDSIAALGPGTAFLSDKTLIDSVDAHGR